MLSTRDMPLLDAIGIDEFEESTYRLLLERPGTSAPELAHSLGTTEKHVRRALANLEQKGLVSRTTRRPLRFMPTPPEIAIEVLVLGRQKDLERTREAAAELGAAFRSARPPPAGPLDVVEVVVGRDAVAQHWTQVQESATDQVRFFDKPPYALINKPEDLQNPVELALLARGIKCRAIYDTDSLAVKGQTEALEVLAEAGEEARVTPNVPMKLAIGDDRIGLIPLTSEEPGVEGALLVHPSPLLEALIRLFDTMWATAVPVSSGEPAADQDLEGLSAEDRELLALLAAGSKDHAVARQLGVAPRTVLRRVGQLMETLGARSRFQAGWLAAKRGWGP